MRVEKNEFAWEFSQLSRPLWNENKSYMRVDESWEARVCMRVFGSTLKSRSNENKNYMRVDESWLDIIPFKRAKTLIRWLYIQQTFQVFPNTTNTGTTKSRWFLFRKITISNVKFSVPRIFLNKLCNLFQVVKSKIRANNLKTVETTLKPLKFWSKLRTSLQPIWIERALE